MPKDQIITTEDIKDPAASKPMDKFQALVARLDDDGIRAAVETLEEAELPAGESHCPGALLQRQLQGRAGADAERRCGA